MVRHINCPPDTFSPEKLETIHDTVYGKPYDLNLKDWLTALLPLENNEPTISRFWCSALVGYIYTKCDLLDPFTNWSFLRPVDFSVESENLNFVDESESLSAEQPIDFFFL